MNSRTGTNIRLLDNLIWNEYQKVSRYKKYQVENREELKSIVKVIFQVIAERVVENKAGVFIRKFGYMFNWKIPNKKIKYALQKKGESIELMNNLYTGNHTYSVIFMPSKNIEGWSMDNTFNRNIKKQLKRKLNSGTEYKNYAFSFQEILN